VSSLFYDEAKIYVKAGDGGNGVVSFRREKYVPEGGPNGGDGGRGGSIFLEVDPGLSTLEGFKYRRHYKAERGQHGMGKDMHGRRGDDLVLRLPAGTIVRDAETGELLADLKEQGQRVLAARGGRGGRGNARFAGAHNRVPRIAEKGEPGEEKWLKLELKLLADVGLVGFPNAGKSSLIAAVSAARPKIADYPFTTITPNLGVVRVDEETSFVMADVPGLIEGAHTGAGLGHRFLKHLERTRVLVHLVDCSPDTGRDVIQDFERVNQELALYQPALAHRPMVVAANKLDLPEAAANAERLKKFVGEAYPVFLISAATGMGTRELIVYLAGLLKDAPLPEITEEPLQRREEPRFEVVVLDDGYLVTGREVERHVAMTDLNNEEAVARFERILKVMGVIDALRQKGIQNGDTVRISDWEFQWLE